MGFHPHVSNLSIISDSGRHGNSKIEMPCWSSTSNWIFNSSNLIYLNHVPISYSNLEWKIPMTHCGHIHAVILVMPHLLFGINYFVDDKLWSFLTPHNCENVGPQITWHACIQCPIYDPWSPKVVHPSRHLCWSLHSFLLFFSFSICYECTT